MSGLSKKIIAVALGLLLIAFTVFYFIHASNRINLDPGTVGATAGNLNNDGLFCEYDGKVYFANSYDEGCLYVMNTDQTGMKKLYNLRASYINAAEDYVFFHGKSIAQSQGIGTVVALPGIYMLRNDGKRLQALTEEGSQVMILIGNYIY